MILGSSPLLVQKGLTESLAGRFELIPITHWSYNEMKQCFGFTLEQYIYFGGYPGAATLVDEHERWVKQKEKVKRKNQKYERRISYPHRSSLQGF